MEGSSQQSELVDLHSAISNYNYEVIDWMFEKHKNILPTKPSLLSKFKSCNNDQLSEALMPDENFVADFVPVKW